MPTKRAIFSLRDFVHSGYCDPKRRRVCVVCRVSVVTNRVTGQNLRTLIGIGLLFGHRFYKPVTYEFTLVRPSVRPFVRLSVRYQYISAMETR